jgi:16S rRNA processing protein RimM
VVAEVLAPHALRGELKCRLITDFPRQRFKRGNRVLLNGQPRTVEGARIQGDTVLLKLAGIDDRTAAESLRGAQVEVPAADTLRLRKGQFFWHQVIGLRVEDPNGRDLGTVEDILETGANDVYVVRGARGEVLVPAIKDVVKLIDPSSGRMLIEPLPGMLPEP